MAIECQRGEALSELEADLSRVTFVPDDAADDTNWIDIVITIDNPTGGRVQVDPRFEVSFTDAGGTEIANQPWVDDSLDSVFAGIVERNFIVQPGQTYSQRIVVFERFSGPLFLRDANAIALESLDSCALASEPAVATITAYEPPPGVSLDLADCAATPDGATVQAELTATNTNDDAVALHVHAEVLDSAGDRLTTIRTNEQSLAVPGGETVTRRLVGNASFVDLPTIAGCQVYFAEPTNR